MDIFLQQIINGLTAGSVYALVALGYTMVYGIIGLINFAHGDVVMVGAMIATSLVLSLVGQGGQISAVMAIGAALHGARAVDAVDIDPAAVESAALNAQANGVQLRTGLPELAQGSYQTVLANILATPLRVLAPLLCSHVAEGGHLVLAGILERQADELMQAYAPWVQLTVADQEDGWILMTARR